QSVNASPDAQFFRVTLLEKPFSYIVPTSSFGNTEQLWDAAGKVIMTMSRRPLREGTDSAARAAGGDSVTAAASVQDSSLRDKTILGWNPLGPGMLVVVRDMRVADSLARAASAAAAATTGGRGGRGGRGGG